MARREARAGRREPDTSTRQGKGGGLFAGLLLGLVIGLVVAAGLAWYFNLGAGSFKRAEGGGEPVRAAPPAVAKSAPPPANAAGGVSSEPQPVVAPEADAPAPPIARGEGAKTPAEPTRTSPATKPRVDYTFYGILPGDKPAKPVDPPKSNETWWLQVAALKSPADADKLKARLAMLGLQVATQKVESAGQSLYRIRVGPYKREDDALGDLDTLAQNNFEPRLFKEPVKPQSPEKP